MLRVSLLVLVLWQFANANPPPPHPHPLDPLTDDEILRTVEAIRRERPGIDWAFHFMALHEPPKSSLLSFFLTDKSIPPNLHIPRKSFSIVRDRASTTPHRVIVNFDLDHVEMWNEDPGKFVQMTEEERLATAAIALADPRVQKRCAHMGYPNMSLVAASGWPIGFVGEEPQYQNRRLFKVGPSGMNGVDDNSSAHPMDFQVIVDAVENRVVAIEEFPAQSSVFDDGSNKTGVMTPRTEFNYVPSRLGKNYFRKDLKPVRACQDGVSFKLNGNQLTWQKWKLRLDFNGREGLVLHWVSYDEGGHVRPLFYRASISEMYIPYGDPRRPFVRDNFFDQGESGLGYRATTLNAGEHCIGNVQFLDVVLHNEKGEPVRVPRAVCIREEDVGIGLKHKGSVTRKQRLSITFISTFSHYDYVYNWHLYEDASIQFNVQLTGALGVFLEAVGAGHTGHGATVAPQITAPYHQHFALLRVDAEIDGNRNTVVQNDIVPGPGGTGSPINRLGNGFTVNSTVYTTAGQARSNLNTATGRNWVISGKWPVEPSMGLSGWSLVPHPSPLAMNQRDSPLFPAGAFTEYNTWVTPYKDGQIFGAGLYVGAQNGERDDLPEWVGKNPNANIANEDVVIWHQFNMPHIPRQEDWPVMNVADLTVTLQPFNFFPVNPAMDVRQSQDRGWRN